LCQQQFVSFHHHDRVNIIRALLSSPVVERFFNSNASWRWQAITFREYIAAAVVSCRRKTLVIFDLRGCATIHPSMCNDSADIIQLKKISGDDIGPHARIAALKDSLIRIKHHGKIVSCCFSSTRKKSSEAVCS